MRALPAGVVAELRKLSSDDALLLLLTITHDDLDTRRHVANPVDVTSRSQTFTAAHFEIALPDEQAERPPAAQLVVGVVDREFVEDVETIKTPAAVLLEIVRSSDLDTVLASAELESRQATYDAYTARVDLASAPVLDEPYPGRRFTPRLFPGLWRR